MNDEPFRRVARTGLAPYVVDLPPGPEWADLTTDEVVQPKGPKRPGWLAGVAAAVTVLVVIGVASFLSGSEDPPPPGGGSTPTGEWTAIDYPNGLLAINAVVIWADDRIILWGGQSPDVEESPTGEPGWSYELNTGEWSQLPASPKDAAVGAGGVWTGDEVIICCGAGDQFDDFPVTVGYDPVANEWRRLADAPISGTFSETVWTGDEMLAVSLGGVAGYDPSTDTWTRYSDPPQSNRLNEVVWTGEELIVWSREVERVVHPGYALNPSTGEWRRLPDPPAWPAAPDLVWTGDRLVIWGGLPAQFVGSERAVGSVYDPVTDTWKAMSEVLPEPDGCECNLGSQALVLAGDRVLIAPGAFGSGVDSTGSLLLTYDPHADSWELVDRSSTPAPLAVGDLVTAGDRMIVRSPGALYLSPQEWVPEGELVTAEALSSSTTTTSPATTTTTATSTTTLGADIPDFGPLFGEETGLVLLLDDGLEGLTAVDLDGRRAARSLVEGQRPGDEAFSMFKVGTKLVVGWDSIHAIDIETRKSRELGRATVFVPAVEADTIWMVDYPSGYIGGGRPTVWQVDGAGDTVTEPKVLNSDSIVLRGIEGGLVLQTPRGIELWDYATGAIAPIDGDPPGAGFVHDVHGSRIAWCAGTCDSYLITEGIQLNAPTGKVYIGGAFSDDGLFLALILADNDDYLGDELLVLNLEMGSSSSLSGTGPINYLTWSPDSTQVFATGHSYGDSRTAVWRYNVTSGVFGSIVLPFGGALSPVVIDSSVSGAYFGESAGDCISPTGALRLNPEICTQDF